MDALELCEMMQLASPKLQYTISVLQDQHALASSVEWLENNCILRLELSVGRRARKLGTALLRIEPGVRGHCGEVQASMPLMARCGYYWLPSVSRILVSQRLLALAGALYDREEDINALKRLSTIAATS